MFQAQSRKVWIEPQPCGEGGKVDEDEMGSGGHDHAVPGMLHSVVELLSPTFQHMTNGKRVTS